MTLGPEELKRLVGRTAADEVRDGQVVGLGTGSTAVYAIARLGQRIKEGLSIVGIPTSLATQQQAKEAGIPLATLHDYDRVDLTIDGADEVDPHLDLIKGLGGALLREKIVASVTDTLVIIVDERKIVERLGTRTPLPVEVVDFGKRQAVEALRKLGCTPALRTRPGGIPLRTDSDNVVIDCMFPSGIDDPASLEARIDLIPSVVENGLFLGMADLVLVGTPTGVTRLTRGG